MKPKTKIIEMTICDHLLCALINADTSGLSDDDIAKIDHAIEKYGPMFHVMCPDETETDFTRCDITGFYSNCLKCSVEVSDDSEESFKKILDDIETDYVTEKLKAAGLLK